MSASTLTSSCHVRHTSSTARLQRSADPALLHSRSLSPPLRTCCHICKHAAPATAHPNRVSRNTSAPVKEPCYPSPPCALQSPPPIADLPVRWLLHAAALSLCGTRHSTADACPGSRARQLGRASPHRRYSKSHAGHTAQPRQGSCCMQPEQQVFGPVCTCMNLVAAAATPMAAFGLKAHGKSMQTGRQCCPVVVLFSRKRSRPHQCYACFRKDAFRSTLP